jgi:hypothetical protein
MMVRRYSADEALCRVHIIHPDTVQHAQLIQITTNKNRKNGENNTADYLSQVPGTGTGSSGVLS